GVAAASVQNPHERMMVPMMMGYYDFKAEFTINGTVEKVEKPEADHVGAMGGMWLVVRTANETYTVHLGPADFVEKTMTFKGGDAVEVTGSKMPMMGNTVMMAREVKKGDATLKLRDDNGIPMWPGMRINLVPVY